MKELATKVWGNTAPRNSDFRFHIAPGPYRVYHLVGSNSDTPVDGS